MVLLAKPCNGMWEPYLDADLGGYALSYCTEGSTTHRLYALD